MNLLGETKYVYLFLELFLTYQINKCNSVSGKFIFHSYRDLLLLFSYSYRNISYVSRKFSFDKVYVYY